MKNVVKAMAGTLMLCLCGCGAGQPGPHPLSDPLQQSSAVEKDERALPQGMGGLESGDGALSGETGSGDVAAHESMAAHEETAPAAGALPGDTVRDRIPVNTTEETVETEWDGIRISRVFGSSGNTMYFCQWAREGREAALYEMEAGAFALQKVDMDIPEGMDIYGISSDASGCLYLLMRTKVSGTEQVRSVKRAVLFRLYRRGWDHAVGSIR